MKKLITLLIACALLVSCGKNAERCYNCTLKVNYEPSLSPSEERKSKVCNKTKAEIKEYEDAITRSEPTTINGQPVTSHTTLDCNKKIF